MCSDKSFFTCCDPEHNRTVTLANGKSLKTAGIGEGFVQCTRDSGASRTIKLTDVLYVPELRGNLISVKKLTSKGYKVSFEDRRCVISRAGEVFATATDSHGLYALDVTHEALSVVDRGKPECIHVWHNRLGHRDPNAISLLDKNEGARDFHIKPCDVLQACECCIKAKMTKVPTPKKSESTTTEVLELIHTDICSPMQTVTPAGNRYFMTMIDDYSKHCTVYLLKNKSEAASKITEFIKSAETKFQKTPKKIRSDRGGEYTGSELKTFLRVKKFSQS